MHQTETRRQPQRGEKNWESFSRVFREIFVGKNKTFSFPRKIGDGGQMSPGLNNSFWSSLSVCFKTYPSSTQAYFNIKQKTSEFNTYTRKFTDNWKENWMGLDISVAGLVQVQLRKAVLSLKLFIQSTLSDFSGGLVMTHPARRVLKLFKYSRKFNLVKAL